MPCIPIKDKDGRVIGIACIRAQRSKATPCLYCGKNPHTKLCDYPMGNGKTCDRKLCDRCAVHVGPDRDLCQDHAKLERASR